MSVANDVVKEKIKQVILKSQDISSYSTKVRSEDRILMHLIDSLTKQLAELKNISVNIPVTKKVG